MLRHKVAVSVLGAVFFLSASDGLRAQTSAPGHRVQAVIRDLRNARQAHEVDLALRALPGVRMSRTDFNTRNLLLEVSPDSPVTEEQIRTVLLPFEVGLTCYTRTAEPGQVFRPFDPRSCGLSPVQR